MASKNKLTIITVTATAPVNYKPRKSTFRFALATEKMTPGMREKYETKSIRLIREQLEEQNPGLEIKYTATSETTAIVGCLSLEDC